MGKRNFDDIIRNKLTDLEVNYQPGHWELMSQRLDETEAVAPPVQDDLLDEVVYEKVHHYTAKGSPGKSWPLLEYRIWERAEMERRIHLYKAAELTVLLFVLFVTMQGISLQDIWEREFKRQPTRPAAEDARQPQALRQDAPASMPPVASVGSVSPADTRTEASRNDLPGTAAAGQAQAAVQQTVPPAGNTAQVLTAQPDLTRLDLAPVDPGRVASLDRPSPSLVEDEAVTRSAGSDLPDIVLPVIAAGQILPDALITEAEQDMADIEFVKPVRKKLYMNVAMFGGQDFNRVMTPPDYQRRTQGWNRYTLGYGGGITTGFEYGRWEMGAGFVYSAKEYRPLPVVFIKGSLQNGYTAEALKTVQLNMLNFPLYAKYHFLKKDKWRSYITMGGSLQVAFEANYFVSPPTFLPPPIGQTDPGESKFKRTEGWFEGGSFKENSYVTANLGLGLERYFSERWGLFFQPTYHQSIGYFSNGLGPNRDRIHTMSLWTGVRVRLLD